MNKVDKKVEDLTKGLRWSARIVGLMATGLFLLFLIESAARVLPTLSWSNPAGMPLFLVLTMAVAGTVIAWRRELVGGLTALAGGMAIIALVYLGPEPEKVFAGFLLALPLLVAGVLHLAGCGAKITSLAQEPRPQTRRGETSVAAA